VPSETTLWEWLRGARRAIGPALHMRRVENAVGVGDGDVDGVLEARDFMLELKFAKRPARESTPLTLGHNVTNEQIDFARDRLAAGGAYAFLIQVGAGADRAIYLVPPHVGPALQARMITEKDLYRYRVTEPASTLRLATCMRKR
jgi:hypothetical protein